MKVLVLAIVLAGCGSSPPSTCQDQLCVCPAAEACVHACTAGAPECDVEGAAGQSVNVACNHDSTCEVECSSASACTVDCGASARCEVTCPPAGCSVANCTGGNCTVSCAAGTTASVSNTTTTCS